MEDRAIQELHPHCTRRRRRADPRFGTAMDSRVPCAEVRFPPSKRDDFVIHSAYRDIPLPLVTSGSENSGNLRELALNRMKDFGAECRDVRFREVGVSSFLFQD